MKAGYVLHSDPDWVRFHLSNSMGSVVGYCRGVGAPMKNVAPGGKLMFIVSGRKPRAVHFWADFGGDPEVTVDEAWDRFGTALGARDRNEWIALVDRLPAIKEKGRLRVIIGNNAVAPDEPIELRKANVPEISNATKGWSLDEWDVERILAISGKVPDDVPMTEQGGLESRYVEGAAKWVVVNRFERSRRARTECLNHWGRRCTACETSLASIYGLIAESLIHVHHLVPMAEIGAEYEVDPVKDLRPICPNCHAVIHSRNPPLTVEEVREALAANRRVS